MADSTSSQADIDRGSSFAAELARDQQHRAKARSVKPLRRLVPFVTRYPGLLFAFVVFLFLAACLTLILPAAFRLVVDCGFSSAGGEGCAMVPASDRLFTYFIAGMGVALALGLASAFRYYFISRLGERVVADLRRATYDHLLGLSPGFYAKVQTGEVLSRLTTDTTLIQTVVGSSVSVAIRTLVTTLGALILMAVVSWKLALLVLIGGPIMLGPIFLFGQRMQRLSRSSQDSLAAASARGSETLRSVDTVQAFTRETEERSAFAGAVERTFDVSLRRIRVRSFMTAAFFSIVLCGLIAVLWYGAVQVQAGAITPGAMTQFVMYSFIAVSGAGMLTETYAEVMRAAGATERLMELLGTKDTLPHALAPATLAQPAEGRIAFEDVHFAYPSRQEQQALTGVSFQVQPGQTVALVGRSGAGKSTLFQLMLRFYDPQTGAISLDGQKLSDLSVTDLRQQLAIVQQNAPLFSGSVADNIRFGRTDASREDIIAAAKAANADEFITALPQGYDTPLGEDGKTLSGGQRQRIAIARAILRDAPVLLLDEATSALDSESEAAIQEAFSAISKDKTTLIIAHRLSTVRNADKIVVLDQGRVVGEGTHDDLMREGGIYADLANLQFGSQADNS